MLLLHDVYTKIIRLYTYIYFKVEPYSFLTNLFNVFNIIVNIEWQSDFAASSSQQNTGINVLNVTKRIML